MSLDSNELARIYSEIQEEFAHSRDIEIHPLSGNPPSQYEVTYHIPCTVKDDQGNIDILTGHTVTIAIPFGFPHFPPSCKPKTQVFHPDFDTAAISLADFWNRDRSLPELIRHIGQMLGGHVYSVENAFNEEAARWFVKNKAQLPFVSSTQEVSGDGISPAEPEEDASPLIEFDESLFDEEMVSSANEESDTELFDLTDFPAAEYPTDIPATPLPADIADTDDLLSLDFAKEQEEDEPLTVMEDKDFASDFEFSDDIPEVESSPPPLPGLMEGDRIDTDKLRHLAHRKNFCQLDTELTSIPGDTLFPERNELTEMTAAALNQAQKLYIQAEEYENQGLAGKALECFRAVEHLVADYPNIRADISRTENSTEMLEDISPPGQHDTSEPPQEKRQKEKASKESRKRSRTETEGEPTAATPKPQARRRQFNVLPYLLVGGVLILLTPLTYFYFTLNGRMTEARQLFSECTTSFAAKDFQAAEKACSGSMATSKTIYFLHQNAVIELQHGIRTILDSEEMRMGLAGKVLFKDQYIPKATLSARKSLQELLDKGMEFLDNSAWDQAAANFQKALELCRQIDDFSPEERMNIEQNLHYAAFKGMLTVAESQVDAEDWQAATATLTELQGQLPSLTPKQQVEYRDYITNLLAKSRFTSLKEQADSLFSKSDWAGAATLFQEAVEAGRALSEKENDEIAGIKANISRAELYSTINAGNSAFGSGNWDEAISKYQAAISILDTGANLLQPDEVQQSRTKLQRIIVQTAIIRDRQSADKALDTGDLQGAQQALQRVISTIRTSPFGGESEFQAILTEMETAGRDLKEKAFIQEKEEYLVANYQRLFLENYSAAIPELLSNPEAMFEKKVGQRYLFKLQCTESGRGRPLTLVMYYIWDPDSKRWSLYNSGS